MKTYPPPIRKREQRIPGVAGRVYQQLIPDFPATALEWVKRCDWIGPVNVPLDEIDFSNRANWTASHEPEKVKKHQELIQEGESKPVILVHLPGHDKLFIADAHHRVLAYEAMNKPPKAYIALIRPSDVEAATTMHSKQYHGGSRLNGT